MDRYVEVGRLSDLEPGSCRAYEVEGMDVALCNVAGTIYALDNSCPHAGGPLGEGELKGEIVICPWHGWRYDVRTGERPENPDFRVATFPVRIEGGRIFIGLPGR